MHILVIDDDPSDRHAALRTLRQTDLEAEVTEAATCAEALEAVGRQDFDVVLMDYNPPDGNAMQALRGLREGGLVSPVIVLTMVDDAETVAALTQAGAADYLPKARLDADLLRRSLRSTLRLAEMQRERRESHLQAIRVLESITDALFTLDSEWRFTYINEQAERLMTKPRHQIMGQSLWEAFPNLVGTQFDQEYRRAVEDGVSVTFQKFYSPLGAWLEVRAYPSSDGLSVFFQDVTERVERRQRESFLADLAERTRGLTDPDAVIADAVNSVGKFLGVSRCLFVDIDIEADTCTSQPDYRADDTVVSMAGTFSISAFGPAVVAAYGAGHAVAVEDVRADPEQVPEWSIANYDAVGIRAHISVPVVHSSRLVSCIGAHSSTPRHWKLEEIELLRTVVERTWLTVEVARQLRALESGAEELRARAEREALLNRIGQALLSATDSAVTEGRAVALLGEALRVDRCYLVSWDYAHDRAFIFSDYRRAELSSIAGEYSASEYASAMGALFAHGTAVVADALSPGINLAVAAVMGGFGLRSLLAVPLFDHGGRLTAALWVAMTDRPRVWTSEEASLVETVAAITRTAVQAARGAERERKIAAQLQAALTPSVPEHVPGMALSKYYEAALDEAGVGGDFYDVFLERAGRTVLAVGDLSGKGLAAASQVATVRNMLRYALFRARTLAGAVRSLNMLLTEQDLLTGFATLFVGAYDSNERTLTYVNCGQEAALLRRAGTGQVEMLAPTGPVLGSFEDASFTELTIPLGVGDAVAIFTDGLTEVGRSRREMLGIEGVSALLRRCNIPAEIDSAEAMAEHLTLRLIAGVDAAALDGVMRDDVCLLVGVVE